MSAFAEIAERFEGRSLAVAIYNTGGTLTRKEFLQLSPEEFAGPFRTTTLGGFLFSRAVLPLLLQPINLEYPPTLIFTGTSPSDTDQTII